MISVRLCARLVALSRFRPARWRRSRHHHHADARPKQGGHPLPSANQRGRMKRLHDARRSSLLAITTPMLTVEPSWHFTHVSGCSSSAHQITVDSKHSSIGDVKEYSHRDGETGERISYPNLPAWAHSHHPPRPFDPSLDRRKNLIKRSLHVFAACALALPSFLLHNPSTTLPHGRRTLAATAAASSQHLLDCDATPV